MIKINASLKKARLRPIFICGLCYFHHQADGRSSCTAWIALEKERVHEMLFTAITSHTRPPTIFFSFSKINFWRTSIKCFHDNNWVSFPARRGLFNNFMGRCRRSNAFCRILQQFLEIRLMSILWIARSTKTLNVHRFIY